MATTSTPIIEQEREKREHALATTVANLRIEDLHLDDESKLIFQRHVDGEIGDKEFHAAIDLSSQGSLPRRVGALKARPGSGAGNESVGALSLLSGRNAPGKEEQERSLKKKRA